MDEGGFPRQKAAKGLGCDRDDRRASFGSLMARTMRMTVFISRFMVLHSHSDAPRDRTSRADAELRRREAAKGWRQGHRPPVLGIGDDGLITGKERDQHQCFGVAFEKVRQLRVRREVRPVLMGKAVAHVKGREERNRPNTAEKPGTKAFDGSSAALRYVSITIRGAGRSVLGPSRARFTCMAMAT